MKDPRKRNIRRHFTSFSDIVIDWASPKQLAAFRHPPTPLCLSGGYGSAKTWAACLKMLWIALTFPKSRILIARKVWEDLKKTTMSTFFKICKPDFYIHGKRSDSEKYLRLNNGSEILWMHMDSEESENVIQGIEINAFFLDQAEEIEEGVFDKLLTRLGRWDQAEVPEEVLEAHGGIEKWSWVNPVNGKPQVPPYAVIACNPADIYHWIYRRFHPESDEHWLKQIPKLDPRTGKPVLDESGKPIMLSFHDLGYTMIQMKSYENKYLPVYNLQQLMAQDENFRRRYVEAEWGIVEGTIHEINDLSLLQTDPKWSDRGVYVDPQDFLAWLRTNCRLFRVLDHGDSSATCCLWAAVDRDGNIFIYREYYMPGKLISEHRRAIAALSQGERYEANLADPSIFYKVQQKYGGRWSVADEYRDQTYDAATAIYWRPADNNELGTRNRINEYLRVDPDHIHPITKKRGAPHLFFLVASDNYPHGCRHSIREVRAQRLKQIGVVSGKQQFSDDRDPKIPDHAYDCVRYIVASRQAPPVSELKKPDPMSYKEVEKKLTQEKPTRLGYLKRRSLQNVAAR